MDISGDPAWGAIAGALMSGAGSYVQYKARNDAAAKQLAAIQANRVQQQTLSDQRQQQVVQNSTQFTPQNSQAALTAAIAQPAQQLTGVAQQAAQKFGASQGSAGGTVSTDFQKAQADQSVKQLQDAIAFAQTQAAGGGAKRLIQEQNATAATGASNVANAASAASRANQYAQIPIEEAGRADPTLSMVGALLGTGGRVAQSMFAPKLQRRTNIYGTTQDLGPADANNPYLAVDPTP